MALLYGMVQIKSAEDEFTRCWSAKDPLSPENVKLAFHAMILLCAGLSEALEDIHGHARK